MPCVCQRNANASACTCISTLVTTVSRHPYGARVSKTHDTVFTQQLRAPSNICEAQGQLRSRVLARTATMFLEPLIHNILLSMEPKYVPPAPEAIQFPKIWTLSGKQGVRQVQKRSNLKLWIPIVPVPRVVQFCEFRWPLVWCDAKFGSGSQRSRGFQGHKSMRLVTKRMNIFYSSTWEENIYIIGPSSTSH